MQKITVTGRLGRDAAIRETQEGSKVISFTMAANERFRGVEKTYWYDVSSFNYDRYKNMVRYLTKGTAVAVVGELDTDVEEGKDGVTRCRRSIYADYIEFNSNNTSGTTSNNASADDDEKPAKKPAAKKVVEEVPDDDEITMSAPKPAKKSTKKAVVEPVPEPEEEKESAEDDDEESEDLPF